MEIEAFCQLPWKRCRVTCEGHMAMCCFMRPNQHQSTETAYIGNVLSSSFDEVWFGDIAESIRKDTLSGKLHKKCQVPACPYSAMRHPYPVQKFDYAEYPDFLEIDLPNTHCNIGGLTPDPIKSPACIMCERSDPFFKPEEDHLFEVLKKIKHIVPRLDHIHIQGIAEPFYESNQFGYLLFDILDALDFDKYAHQITVSVTTNGTLMKRSVRQEYISRIPHSITTFSIDAATPETFKKIRILNCFDKIIENLYAFSKERVRGRQFLKINNNINILNVHEVLGMVDIGHKAEVEQLEFNPTDGFNTGILVNEDNCGLFKKAEIEISEECTRLKIPYLIVRPLDLGITDRLVQLTL